MNSKKVALCAAVGFLVIFAFDWVWHGRLMMNAYTQTAALWRTPEAMQSLMAFCLFGHLVFATAAALIFAHGYKGTGRGEGIKYGFYLGTLLASLHILAFVYTPIPFAIILGWMAGDYLKSMLLGLVFVAVHDQKIA